MTTPVWLTGFEYGVNPVAAGGGLLDSQAGSPTLDSATKRTGSYALRLNVASQFFQKTLPSADYQIGSFYIYFKDALPSGDTYLVYGINTDANMYIRFESTDSKLYAGKFAVGEGSASSVTIAYNTWYRIDYRFYTNATTHTIDWQIDGTAQTQYSVGSRTAVQLTAVRFPLSNITADQYIDDVIISATSGDYPIGPHAITGHRPNADGTHNAGTNVIEDQAGNDIGAVTAYNLLDEDPWATANTDYVRQVATGTGNYAEINFADYALGSGIIGAIALLQYRSSGTTANEGGCVIIDEDATQTTLWGDPTTRADYSEVSMFYKNAMLPTPSGGWDAAAVNALKARIGYSNNVTTYPYWQALLIEVCNDEATTITLDTALAAASGTPITVSAPSGGATVTLDTSVLSLSGVPLTLSAPISIALNTSTITVVGIPIDVIPGSASIKLNTALLSISGQPLTVVAGEATTTLDTALLSLSGQKLSIVAGATSVSLSTALLVASSTPITISVVQPEIVYVSWAQLKIPESQNRIVSLDTATINVVGVPLTVLTETTIALDTALLSISGVPLMVVAGTAYVQIGTALITATAVPFSVIAGEVAISLDTAPLTLFSPQIMVAEGEAFVLLDTALLNLAGVPLAVTTITTVTLGTALITSYSVPLTVVEGTATVQLGTAVLSVSGVPLLSAGGAAVISLQTALLTANGIALSVVAGEVSILLNTAPLLLNGISLTVVEGATAVTLQSAALTLAGVSLTVGVVNPAIVYVSWVELKTPVPSIPTTTVNLSTALIIASGINLSVVPGAVSIVFDTATLSLSGVVLTVISGIAPVTITLDTAVILLYSVAVAVIPGSVTVTVNTGLLSVSGIKLAVFIGTPPVLVGLGTGVILVNAIALDVIAGAVTVGLDTSYITISWVRITVVTIAPVLISTDTALLSLSGNQLMVVGGAVSIGLDTAIIVTYGIVLAVLQYGVFQDSIFISMDRSINKRME